jgi:hypothetical protein
MYGSFSRTPCADDRLFRLVNDLTSKRSRLTDPTGSTLRACLSLPTEQRGGAWIEDHVSRDRIGGRLAGP